MDRNTGSMNRDGVDTVGCKSSSIQAINRRVCRNNCRNWNWKDGKCLFGFK